MQEVQEVEAKQEEQTQESLRKKLQLEWIDSEWFQVWLKLARREYHEH